VCNTPLYPPLTLSTNEESEIKDNDLAYFSYWPCIFMEKLRKTTPFPCPFSKHTSPQTFGTTCLMTLNKTCADYTVKGMAPNKNAHWMQCSDFHLSTINSLNGIFNNFHWTLSGCFNEWQKYSLFILVIIQLDAQNLFNNKFISCLYMFLSSTMCSSSGGQNCILL
jgi:hypothetical protein